MKELFMVSPEYFDVVYDINPWMTENLGGIDKEKATTQWHNLKKLLEENNVKVHSHKPNVKCPDTVFTANHGIVLENTFVATNFLKKERKLELPYIIPHILKTGEFSDYDQCPYPWEGEAELLHYKNNLYIGGFGKRGTKLALDWFENEYDIDVIPIEIKDDRFYHLDTCLTVRNEKVFLYPEAFEKESLKNLKNIVGKHNVINVSKKIAFSFALNCIQLPNCVIVGTQNQKILKELTKLYNCKVIGTDMSEFISSGGSCFCSKLWLKK